jgi:hypothetical protein
MCTHMKLEGNVSNDAALSKAGGRATDKFEGTLVAALGLSCELISFLLPQVTMSDESGTAQRCLIINKYS